MGMNINFQRARGTLRMPQHYKNEEDIKKNPEYQPQELIAEEVKEEAPKAGGIQPKTHTPSQKELDTFLQNYEQLINNPNISWND